ncbi:AAA domain-containing protein [uncultured Corynebacterium sp.]|uniref:AAA domain-containing protein n=1 Tax=uncultured Corynebacterium sp. TaxID=159447 RepID=UPI00259B35B9|nr:AAA domain-containing protein [uncultured Corynebacterium sp.]
MDYLADKASRLFQFLADLQAQKDRPVKRISEYGSGSQWLTLHQLKEIADAVPLEVSFNPSLLGGLTGIAPSADDVDGYLVRIERPAAPPALTLPDELKQAIPGSIDNPSRRPQIVVDATAVGPSADQLTSEAEAWLLKWDKWAAAARALNLYQSFFDMQVKATQQADEFELVLGSGWLTWALGNDESIDRPIFMLNLEISMDKISGAIEIRDAGEPIHAELEALSASHMDDGRFIQGLKAFLDEFAGYLIDIDEFEELAQFTVNGLSAQARYEPELEPVESDGRAVLSWAPTILLRPRQRAGLSSTFRLISQLIEDEEQIPAGLRPLVDPSYRAEVASTDKPGAMFEVGGDLYSPLPLNEKQKRVLEHVDSHAHTIVQGPPGTGKTHMAAALLSHLLAQGKRVLVTAETERALYELRDKLPAEIRELAVSVIGSSSREMSELRTAIETIQRQSSNFDERISQRKIAALETELDSLREQRMQAVRAWAGQLEAEQKPLNIEGYQLPLPQLIQKVDQDREKYSWIEEISLAEPISSFPLDPDEVNLLLDRIEDPTFAQGKPYSGAAVLDPGLFSSPTQFRTAALRLEEAKREAASVKSFANPVFLPAWLELTAAERKLVEGTVVDLKEARRSIDSFPRAWVEAVPPGTHLHDLESWETSRQRILEKLESMNGSLDFLGDVQRISVDGQFDAFVPQAQNLQQYFLSGKTLNVRPDGSVKHSLFGGGAVKAAMPFIEAVRINGLPPTNPELVGKYLTYVSVIWELQSLQKSLNFTDLDIADPVGSARSFREDAEKFGKLLDLVRRISNDLEALDQRGFEIALGDIENLEVQLSTLNRVEDANRAVEIADREYAQKSGLLTIQNHQGPRHQWIEKLESAIASHDVNAYEEAMSAAAAFHHSGLERQRFLELLSTLRRWSEGFAEKIEDPVSRGIWGPRLKNAREARNWLLARRKIESMALSSREDSQSDLERIDRKIHDAISSLAAERAWSEAVGGARMDGAMRATMQAYVQAVRRLGKGTGKYADQRRRDVRRHLDSAREAVPVWIMPIYKVVEQFELKQNMFDVVIIDEASQAGVESIFLQYLAPKVVVVGDDRQVSPSGVGEDIGRLQKLARQYLYDFDAIDAWVDPKRSLFDDANMRYGGRIALDEHRRCVPEIIEFSNELVYRPNNIELKPVREPASERLAPFRLTRTPNAFQTNKKKVNRREADVLVERLIGVLEDEAYDGKTIGVISLLSTSGQADYIRNQLLTAVPPHVWEERDLKVGSPADFQGAERDVIFLSLVTAVPHQTRVQALTQLQHEQRYNVAVSRAKDQVWLFHSIGLEDLPNQDDVRYKLLEYAYRVAESSPEKRISQLVSFDERVEPFDSLFEQRVYNELVRRGYFVIPQFDAFGRKIDLVVQGQGGRLAVECDGDFWHSEEYAIADRSRQRELERLGWAFARLFESDFYLDPHGQIQRIVDRLDELGIQPGYVEGVDFASADNIEIIETESDPADTKVPFSQESTAPGLPLDAIAQPPLDDELAAVIQEDELSSEPVVEGSRSTQSLDGLEPYVEFKGSTVSVYAAGPDQIDQGLAEIIAVEGPIPEVMLFQRYVKAGGDHKVAGTAQAVLRAGMKRLLRRGTVVEAGGSKRIYKTPDQPDVRPRTKGSRIADDISPNEWEMHMRAVMAAQEFQDEEELLRATHRRVGYGRFTGKMHERLAEVRDQIGDE